MERPAEQDAFFQAAIDSELGNASVSEFEPEQGTFAPDFADERMLKSTADNPADFRRPAASCNAATSAAECSSYASFQSASCVYTTACRKREALVPWNSIR